MSLNMTINLSENDIKQAIMEYSQRQVAEGIVIELKNINISVRDEYIRGERIGHTISANIPTTRK